MMGVRAWLKPRVQDWSMRFVDRFRSETLAGACGNVLEVGFGTGLNLPHYGSEVRGLWGLDPMNSTGLACTEKRIAQAPFPVERVTLRADGQLPFDAGHFDTVVTTWTLCSIPDTARALGEMRRVLKPGGRYLFIEHGRSRNEKTVRWQDRLNPTWLWLSDGCNLNRPIDEIVTRGGFELASLNEFLGRGPAVVSSLYRGAAIKP